MTVIEKAYAKINLFLDVTGRREDGFHDIISVMQSVSLCDTITVTAIPDDEKHIKLICDDASLPTDENNLIYKTALKYLAYFEINANVDISLNKLIPVGAGLGGGSSDAAATLRALNKIYGLASKEQLLEMAAELGSDVPFCLFGGLYLCGGRGEKLMKLEKRLASNYVIAIGQSRISTPKAYRELDLRYNNFTDKTTDELALLYRKMIADLANDDGETIPLYNIFEKVILIDEINNIKESMTKNGAEYTLMSGSGPSVFGKYKNAEDAKMACESLRNLGFSAFCCNSVNPEENI